jgi:hypothetical protein
MPTALARQYVAASPFAPHRFGLFSVVDSPPSERFRGGIEVQANPCNEAASTGDDCPTGISPHKLPNIPGLPTSGATPFTVFAWIDCSPVGSYEAIQERTISALRNGEERAVERVVWTGAPSITGAATVYPHHAANATVLDPANPSVTLQTAAVVAVTGTPAITRALGALEGAFMQCYGGEGVIHVPAEALANLARDQQIVRDGDRLRTWNGNRVAVYASNNLQGPTGVAAAPGKAWLYATTPVSMRRTGIEEASTLPEGLDRSNNTLRYIAERTYVIDWDCCSYAVQTDLTL